VLGDAFALIFLNSEVDCVLALNAVHCFLNHVDEKSALLGNCYPKLRVPEGLI